MLGIRQFGVAAITASLAIASGWTALAMVLRWSPDLGASFVVAEQAGIQAMRLSELAALGIALVSFVAGATITVRRWRGGSGVPRIVLLWFAAGATLMLVSYGFVLPAHPMRSSIRAPRCSSSPRACCRPPFSRPSSGVLGR